MMDLTNLISLQIVKSLSSVVAERLNGNPQFWEAPLAQVHAHFSSGCDFMMGLGKLKQHTKFELASFSRGRNIRGTPKFWGAPLAQGHAHFSSLCNFMMGLGKSKLRTKFEVDSFSHCRNIKGEPLNFRELP